MVDIVSEAQEVNLDQLAVTIRAELKSESRSGAEALHHAMAAGDALNLAQANRNKSNLSWKQWLRENCLVSTRTAFVRQQLAEHRSEIEAAMAQGTDIQSIAAALRLIAKKKKKAATSKPPADVAFFLANWGKADRQTRAAILDAIGVEGLLAALSQQLRGEIERRVLKHHRHTSAKTNKTSNNEKAAAALRQALSAQKVAKDANVTAMGVAAALNAINNLLAKDGIDLNCITGLTIDIDATMANSKAA
jgi:hypothetical protein